MRLTRRGRILVEFLVGVVVYIVVFAPPGWWLR